jgi:hypothetical protein
MIQASGHEKITIHQCNHKQHYCIYRQNIKPASLILCGIIGISARLDVNIWPARCKVNASFQNSSPKGITWIVLPSLAEIVQTDLKTLIILQ